MSSAEPAHLHDVRVDEHIIRVDVRGTDGVPLVLASGLGLRIESWGRLRAAFGKQRTIAFDAPGVGCSSTPRHPLSMRTIARLGLQAVTELGYDEVDVLGYSFGGAVAQEMARRAPHRVRRLVLAATNFGWGSPLGDPFAVVPANRATAFLAAALTQSVAGGR